MADLSLAFQAENSISIDDVVAILYGASNPAVVGETAPVGSLYLRTSGELFQKVGVDDTQWNMFTQGFDQLLRISATDTTSSFLSNKLLVAPTLSKTIDNVGDNETLTISLSATGVVAGTYRSITVDSFGRAVSGTNPTTLAGYGITDAQPLDATLTALASYNANGILTQVAPDVFVSRQITGTANQITVQDGAGAVGNPTLSFPSTGLQFPGTDGVVVPSGTTAQRIPATGKLRFNATTSSLEYFNGSTWVSLVETGGGTVTSVAAVSTSPGIQVTGSPITSSGTLSFSVSDDLAAIEGIETTGFAVRTATDSWQTRAILGTANKITVTNGTGATADPVITISSTYAGQTSINTLGTVTSGTWAASVIGTSFGGTGRSTIGAANEFLAVNNIGSALEYKVLLGGAGVSVVSQPNQTIISNTGVTSIAGTSNQVSVSAATGSVVMSLPQDIAVTSSPTFSQVVVAADPTQPLQVATKQYVDSAIEGLDVKASVHVATTGNITLSGLQTIDGHLVSSGDRVLVKDQTDPAQNGIYVVDSGAWTRAHDMDAWSEVAGAFVYVEIGDLFGGSSWISVSQRVGILGATPVVWSQFSSAIDIVAGTGLTRTGNTISITDTGVTPGVGLNTFSVNAQGQITSASTVGYLTQNQQITLTGDATGTGTVSIPVVLADTGVAAGTYRSVTVDTKGRVITGTNPTTLAGYAISDAQPLDGDLTSIAALTGAGLPVRVGTNSWALRTVVAGSTRVAVLDGNGVAGNISIDVNEANLTLNSIGGTLSPLKGGTGLSTLGTPNQIIGVNSAGTGLEFKSLSAGPGISIVNSAGDVTISGNTGTVTSVAITGSTGLSVVGSPITSAGTISLVLGTELQGLSALSGNGVVVKTAAGAYTSRSVVSGVGTITITNPAGTAGNIGIDLTTIGTAGTYKSVTTDAYGRVTSGTNPTTLAGFGITDAISTSEKGAANGVATLDANGLVPTSQLPPLSISDVFTVASQTAMLALTAQRGDFAVRTDVGRTFVLAAEPATTLSNWVQLLDGPSGTVTSVATTAPASGFTITGGPITSSGTLTFTLADDLAAVEALATTGIAVRTGTSTWATRSLVAGTGISITNANGVAGNITIAATNTGTVTSVGLTAPSIFTVSSSPVTSSGTIALALANQSAGTVFAGPVSGSAAPTFRTLSLDELSDVVLTSPTPNQVLAYNGTSWVNTGAVGANAAGLIGSGQAGSAAWALVSGSTYRADFAHNLGTTNVVITVFNSSTNAVVIPNSIVLLDNNTVRISVTGNSLTLRVVVVANGQSIVAGGSTPSSVITAKDGVTVSSNSTRINFTGQAVGVADAGGGTTNVTVGSRFTYFANSLDNPITADFAVNSLAPTITDPSFSSLNVRSFSNTVEQGVATIVAIPAGATTMVVKMRGRAATAPAAASVAQFRLYSRAIPNNAAVGAWSAALELDNIAVPTNANFQYFTQTLPLGGLTAGNVYQLELTRRVTGVVGTNLTSAFLLVSLEFEFF